MIDLYLLIPAVNAQTLPQNSQYLHQHQLMKQIKKLKHSYWQQKQKQENAQSNLKPYTLCYAIHLLNLYVLFLLEHNFWFCLFL